MQQLSLTPATQAVLDALTDLGQGDVHELADKSGKARSTTDKAIKTLADAGVIVAVNPDADLAEGTPTRWTLATPSDADALLPVDVAGETDIGDPDPDNTADRPHTEVGHEPTDAVHAAAEHDQPDDGSDDTIDTPDTATADQAGSQLDSDNAAESDGATVDGTDRGEEEPARTVAVVQPARPGDRKVMAIKGVLADHGDGGATLDVIVAESGISHPTASRLLTAMEQADAARRLPGLPQRWIPGPTKASEVDPNPEPPRCPLCYQVIRGLVTAPSATAAVLPLIRADGTLHVVAPDGEAHIITLPQRIPPRAPGITAIVGRRSDGSANADGSQPLGRGELEKLTLDVLTANPGRAMTPQDIATAISGQLGRAVSSGAVRNNCTKAAAGGRILLASETPLTFTYPVQADPSPTASTSAEQPGQDDNDAEQS
ncbi:MarR family transcriptional regulator [Micromonospora sp. M51]|uniref:MarR family transcriptional regulator n=1 Tax=Micromonospora sp. M51 TaxID=2824889 RepID=UPI001B39348D|nr:MarR family transcriptional regulator [Micromonospora sp. M51]MBQ1011082.1 MarR family transcriptional regulator [Micromonospora sp. M51]